MPSVDILMATYNGENYIESQILSLIAQSHQDWRLIIHDDGSTDNTVFKVKCLAQKDDRIELIEDNVVTGGAANNFKYLLQFVEADIVMFCDQDDVWLDDKIAVMLKEFNECENDIPVVLYSRAYLYKASSHSIYGVQPLVDITSLEDFLFLNAGALGCTIMANKKAVEIAKAFTGELAMHDHLLCLIGTVFGKVGFINDKLMLYRQHAANTTGNQPGSLFDKLKSFFRKGKSVIDKRHYDSVKSFYIQFNHLMDDYKKNIIEEYLSFPSKALFGKIGIIFRNRFRIFGSSMILIIKTITRKAIL